jgi:Stress responsive A/B Barrel Domain
MIHHMVLFKLKPGFDKNSEPVKQAVAAMKVLPTQVPQIRQWTSGENFTDRSVAYDFGLYSTFDHRADLAAYAAHPEHVKVIEMWRAISDWHICDFSD